MLETFKARLKAKTKATGVNLSTKRIDAYADRLHKKNPDVKDDAEHDTLIDALDELVSFSDIAKQDDQVRTLEAKVKAQPTPAPPKDDDEDEDEDEDVVDDAGTKKPKKDSGKEPKKKERIPAYAKAIMDELKSLKAEKVQTSMRSKLADKLKDEEGKPKVPEKFYNKRALPEKEEDLDAFVEEIEADWAEINPVEATDTKTTSKHQPKRGTTKADSAPKKEEIDAIMSKIM